VIAEPVYVFDPEQLIDTEELAWPMVKVVELLLPAWFASPAKVALAPAVPALVLLE
jgi:hypothetical protein